MNSLNKKDTIIALLAYILFAVFVSYGEFNMFSLVYFAVIGTVIVFSGKLFPENPFALPQCFTVGLAAAVSHSTMYELFIINHGDTAQLLSALSIGIFFVGISAATGTSALPLSVIIAPALCFLNIRIAVCYSLLLSAICMTNIFLNKTNKKKASNKKKGKTQNKKSIYNFIAVIVALISLAICISLIIRNPEQRVENISYYKSTFKNNPAVIAASVYLLRRLIKSNLVHRIPAIISVLILAVAAFVGKSFLGWTLFALMWLCILAYLLYCTVQNTNTLKNLKSDFCAHRLLFGVLLLLLLQ